MGLEITKGGSNDRLVESIVKFGGGHIILWGCMSWDGIGEMCRIDGRMDGQLYVDILEDDLLKSIDWFGKNPQDIIFQQDNHPKHTCKKAKDWFEQHQMTVMEWPAQSPDLNLIEHLWGSLKRRLADYDKAPTSIKELWERVQVEWEAISEQECQGLVESMPDRIQAVLQAKGGYTKY